MATVSMAGFAAASTVTFDTTGPDSHQSVHLNNSNRLNVDNDNSLRVTNSNRQEAETGNVRAHENTSVGGLSSGAASNDNSTATTLSVDNSGSGLGSFDFTPANDTVSMSLTGPDSRNNVTIDNRNSVRVDNDNHITVSNCNNQSAESGNVSASDNTTVGDMSSGDASNTNSTTTSVDLSN